jgi:hypothetical protein
MNIMKRFGVLAFIFVCGVLAHSSRVRATLVPPLKLETLTSHADLIVVGRVAEVREEGGTTVDITGSSYSRAIVAIK